ncbi:MAG: hypothetical protein E4G90_08260 [Gemmatimonadales bacterium]|nr:MAG: hypothetical protein E4G90_08260 [Gemmatimonadales bacterium]
MGASVHAPVPGTTVTQPIAPTRRIERQRPAGRLGKSFVVGVSLVLLAATLAGLPYYSAPIGVRVRSVWHPWLRPSGYLGQSAGIVAFLIFAFLWLYPLRKRYRWLAFTGAVGKWLDVHVATALLMPLLVGLHAGWRFEGLIGLGYAAILIVCASGIIGRYIYSRIPRNRTGVELGLGEVTSERRALLTEIAAATKLTPESVEARLETRPRTTRDAGLFGTFAGLIRDDIARWRAVRRFRAEIRLLDRRTLRKVARLARREAALGQQARMLEATQRVFRFWHVAHRPVAVTALLAVILHVAIVVTLGATWFW